MEWPKNRMYMLRLEMAYKNGLKGKDAEVAAMEMAEKDYLEFMNRDRTLSKEDHYDAKV